MDITGQAGSPSRIESVTLATVHEQARILRLAASFEPYRLLDGRGACGSSVR